MAYEEEIVDDYITGAEQVGADPTAATAETVDTVESVDTVETVEAKGTPGPEVTDFKEYDLNEYEVKELDPNHYDEGFYDYTTNGAKPTVSAYEDEIGPAVPAETDFTESSVSGHRLASAGTACRNIITSALRLMMRSLRYTEGQQAVIYLLFSEMWAAAHLKSVCM